MSMFAPVIAALSSLVAGLAVLVWMNRNQPVLRKSPTSEPVVEDEPSLEDIWHARARIMPLATQTYKNVTVHPE